MGKFRDRRNIYLFFNPWGKNSRFFYRLPPVRLADGSTPSEGRVEVFSGDAWGTVCDNRWSLRDAMVICRELGLGGAVGAPKWALFGRGFGLNILLDNVGCTGNEETIFDCRHSGLGIHNCHHFQDAGVRCGK